MDYLSPNISEITISHPEMWKLALRLDSKGLKFTIHSTVEDNTLIYRDIRFTDESNSYLSNLENAIYDYPVLFESFNKVSIIIESPTFVIVPQEFSSTESIINIFDYTFPNFEGARLSNNLHHCEATIVYGVELGVDAFLCRTFENVTIKHSIHSLCEYFQKKSRLGNVSKLYAFINDDSLHVCVFSRNNLMLANSFKLRDINDIAYYILNCWQVKNLDALKDELHIYCPKDSREELMAILRKYIAFVMPTIFPSAMLKAGQDAMLVPFDLIVLPLCE